MFLPNVYEFSTTVAVACGILIALGFRAFLKPKVLTVPSIGRTGPIGSWITAIMSLRDGHLLLRQGYDRYRPGPFSLRFLGFGDMVFVTRETIREEVRKTSEDILSVREALGKAYEFHHTLGLKDDDYLGPMAIRLTRNLEELFPEMYDELRISCDEELSVPSDGSWAVFRLGDTLRRIISRSSNRVIVGLPLCRNPEWRDLHISFTFIAIIDGTLLKIFPNFLKPLIVKYLSRVPRELKRATRLMSPLIDERMRLAPVDRPNDVLTWFMEEASTKPDKMKHEALAFRAVFMNFAAIFTTSGTAQDVIFDLAARPHYVKPLRDEVDEMTQKYGWTKKAISHMRKLDSFIRESQRLGGISLLALTRVAMRDHSLSDGTFLPKGTWVSAPAQAIHFDDENYLNASQFDGFRFSRLQDNENACNQYVSTSPTFLPFGHGNACPGRFFAANEIKALVAHLLVTYDIMMKDGVRPEPIYIGMNIAQNDRAEICFRRRMERGV